MDDDLLKTMALVVAVFSILVAANVVFKARNMIDCVAQAQILEIAKECHR